VRRSPIVDTVFDHVWLFAIFAWLTLAVELGAPLALWRRRVRHAWILAAWAFHAGVLALMVISFPYQLSGIAYASLVPVEKMAQRVPQYGGRRAVPTVASPVADEACGRSISFTGYVMRAVTQAVATRARTASGTAEFLSDWTRGPHR
jgi:hypothetical protein